MVSRIPDVKAKICPEVLGGRPAPTARARMSARCNERSRTKNGSPVNGIGASTGRRR
jgi:uncharacterized protein YbbK (DUF523 family)